jgi:hypothetical protein
MMSKPGAIGLEGNGPQGREKEGKRRSTRQTFVGFSYGFRPGRGQHDALDALHTGMYRRQVNWVLAADI